MARVNQVWSVLYSLRVHGVRQKGDLWVLAGSIASVETKVLAHLKKIYSDPIKVEKIELDGVIDVF